MSDFFDDNEFHYEYDENIENSVSKKRRLSPTKLLKQNALKRLEELKSENLNVRPISSNSTNIAKTPLGKAWCKHISTIVEEPSVLKSARTYLKHHCIVDISPAKSFIKSKISGNILYDNTIEFLKKSSSQKILFQSFLKKNYKITLELLKGTIDQKSLDHLKESNLHIFPEAKEIKAQCNCLEWENVCKHSAAVLYAIGILLDEDPEFLFSVQGFEISSLLAEKPTLNELNPSVVNLDLASKFDIQIGSTDYLF